MKRLILLFVLFFAVITVNGQSPVLFDINQHPAVIATKTGNVTTDMKMRAINDSTYTLHAFRGAISVKGVQFLYNKVLKEIEPLEFDKIGVGGSYSFYRVRNGLATKYLSLNGFVFLPFPESHQSVSFALGVSALNIMGLNLNPEVGINVEPGLWKSDYFPVGALAKLTYVF